MQKISFMNIVLPVELYLMFQLNLPILNSNVLPFLKILLYIMYVQRFLLFLFVLNVFVCIYTIETRLSLALKRVGMSLA